MKLDFFAFGGGDPAPQSRPGTKLPQGLVRRYMRQRYDVTSLDDANVTVRTGVITAALFFGAFLLFALIAPISGAAIAPGTVAVSGNKMLIQPSGTGIVSDILVREGQPVRAGQPLVRLNGIRSGAQLKQAQARRDSLRALEARLIAERDGHPRLAFPTDLAARASDPSAIEAMRAQLVLFERHQAVLAADRTLTDTRLVAAQARRVSSERQLALINDEMSGVQSLYERGFARKTTLRALQRSAAQLQSDVTGDGASIQEAELNRQRTRDSQLLDIVGQLSQVQEQLAQVNPQLDVNRYLADQDVMRSAVDGRVSNVAQIGPGTVVSGGRTLMEVVPNAGALIVEAQVKPEDIDDVAINQTANVSFSTVNPRGQTVFPGRVVTLSPTRIDGEQGGGYFRAQIAVDVAALQASGVQLQPGVPASVQIETDRRTLWDYLIAPLRDAISRSFREE